MTVTASPADQARLLDLQALDNRDAQLKHAGKSLAQHQKLTELKAQSDALRRQLAEARGALDDSRIELKRTESDVSVVEARILRDTQRLAASSSLKDVQGLEHELASLRNRRSNLEEIQLTVMEQVEERESDLQALQQQGETLRSTAAALIDQRDAALEQIQAEQADLTAAREALVSTLPGDLVALYERQRASSGVGAALLRRGVSEGSNMKLTESDLAEVRRAAPDQVVLDPESGCILVRTEESGI